MFGEIAHARAGVSVDPSQFEAALLNPVVNARDAVGDKGPGAARPMAAGRRLLLVEDDASVCAVGAATT